MTLVIVMEKLGTVEGRGMTTNLHYCVSFKTGTKHLVEVS